MAVDVDVYDDGLMLYDNGEDGPSGNGEYDGGYGDDGRARL